MWGAARFRILTGLIRNDRSRSRGTNSGTPILWRRSDKVWSLRRSGSGLSKRRARYTPEPRRRSAWMYHRRCSPAPTRSSNEETYILEASAAKLGTEPNAHSLSRSNLANAGLRLDVLLRCLFAANQEVFQNVFFVCGRQ